MTDQEWVTEFSKPNANWIELVRKLQAESRDEVQTLQDQCEARLAVIDLLGATCKDFRAENDQLREKVIDQRRALSEIDHIAHRVITVGDASDAAALFRCGVVARSEIN
jgi:thiamine kinase-like enzyme